MFSEEAVGYRGRQWGAQGEVGIRGIEWMSVDLHPAIWRSLTGHGVSGRERQRLSPHVISQGTKPTSL